jgi:hypothetical protein
MTNAVAYSSAATITTVKGFTVQTRGKREREGEEEMIERER